MGEASSRGRSQGRACGAQLPPTKETPAHLVGDGLVVDEVGKGDGGRPGVVLVVDAGAGGLVLLPPGDGQRVPASAGSRGARRAGTGQGSWGWVPPWHAPGDTVCPGSGRGRAGRDGQQQAAAPAPLGSRGITCCLWLLRLGQETQTRPGAEAAARCPTHSSQPQPFLAPTSSRRT